MSANSVRITTMPAKLRLSPTPQARGQSWMKQWGMEKYETAIGDWVYMWHVHRCKIVDSG